MDLAFAIAVEHAGPIGVGLLFLGLWLINRYVRPVWVPWRIRVEWKESEQEHRARLTQDQRDMLAYLQRRKERA